MATPQNELQQMSPEELKEFKAYAQGRRNGDKTIRLNVTLNPGPEKQPLVNAVLGILDSLKRRIEQEQGEAKKQLLEHNYETYNRALFWVLHYQKCLTEGQSLCLLFDTKLKLEGEYLNALLNLCCKCIEVAPLVGVDLPYDYSTGLRWWYLWVLENIENEAPMLGLNSKPLSSRREGDCNPLPHRDNKTLFNWIYRKLKSRVNPFTGDSAHIIRLFDTAIAIAKRDVRDSRNVKKVRTNFIDEYWLVFLEAMKTYHATKGTGGLLFIRNGKVRVRLKGQRSKSYKK